MATRDLKEMGRVWGELLRAVYSPLTDEQAAERIGELVRSDRRAAAATLRYVRRARDRYRSYDTDRAYRVLVAAINGASPEPVGGEDAELFERERELGWMSLDQAFEQLMSAVPELEAIRAGAEQLARSPDAFGIERDEDGVVIPAGVLPTAKDGALRLVGSDSRHADPLIRSPIAASVVANYVTAILTDTTHRALWDYDQPTPRVRVTGSFF